jgi:hypothetical protein
MEYRILEKRVYNLKRGNSFPNLCQKTRSYTSFTHYSLKKKLKIKKLKKNKIVDLHGFVLRVNTKSNPKFISI